MFIPHINKLGPNSASKNVVLSDVVINLFPTTSFSTKQINELPCETLLEINYLLFPFLFVRTVYYVEIATHVKGKIFYLKWTVKRKTKLNQNMHFVK